MAKASSAENNGFKKGPWTPEEDQKLIDYIQKHGHGKWRTLPKNAGLKRCGKSCRLRWANYLRPDIKRGKFTLEEEEAIIQLHSVLGNKWSTIAANLPGRTDNEIKNYWNTHIKKKLLKMGIDPVTHEPRLDVLQLASILNSTLQNSPQFNYPGLFGNMGRTVNPSHVLNLLTTLLSLPNRNLNVVGSPLSQLQNQSQISQQLQLDPNQTFQPNQSIQQSNCVTSNILELMKTKLQNQTSQISNASVTPFSNQNILPNLWQYNYGSDQTQKSYKQQPESLATNSIIDNILENQILFYNEGMPNFNLSSLLSSMPSSSSPSTLNSSSSTTFVKGATEDERDSYGSNMLTYNNVSNGFNDSALL